MKIHELLKTRRTALKASQEQIAIKARLAQSHVSQIESGAKDARISTVEKIATALDCHFELKKDK